MRECRFAGSRAAGNSNDADIGPWWTVMSSLRNGIALLTPVRRHHERRGNPRVHLKNTVEDPMSSADQAQSPPEASLESKSQVKAQMERNDSDSAVQKKSRDALTRWIAQTGVCRLSSGEFGAKMDGSERKNLNVQKCVHPSLRDAYRCFHDYGKRVPTWPNRTAAEAVASRSAVDWAVHASRGRPVIVAPCIS
jgi:hypothetical protein